MINRFFFSPEGMISSHGSATSIKFSKYVHKIIQTIVASARYRCMLKFGSLVNYSQFLNYAYRK